MIDNADSCPYDKNGTIFLRKNLKCFDLTYRDECHVDEGKEG
ncbi:hypothetical protein Saga11_08720 [Bacillus safensis]|nr:hypothetical protein Saga11_08720 [Bacillus safensis]